MLKRRTKIEKSELNITSMMDMFTIILVFLIMNFGAEGNLVTSSPNLVLPDSKEAISPEEVSLMIAVDEKWVLVDDKQVMSTDDAKKQDSLTLAPVLALLTQKRLEEQTSALGRTAQDGELAGGNITAQFDREMEYDIITKVSATAGYAGYTNVKFAVVRLGED